MKRFKYSLVASSLALISIGSTAATYQIVDLKQDGQSQHSYGMGVNANGDTVGMMSGLYNYPVNIDDLNINTLTVELANLQAANPGLYDDISITDIENGDLNASALLFIKSYLSSNWSSQYVQKFGDRTAFAVVGENVDELTLFDEELDGFNGKSRSTLDIPYAINDNGVVVSSGTGVYRFSDFTPAATEDNPEPETQQFWRKDFLDRKGVVSLNGQNTVIEGEYNGFGGATILSDISNNNYVVGYAAVQVSRDASLGLEGACPDEEDLDVLQQCAWSVKNSLVSNNSTQSFFRYRAYRWKLDDNLEVVETKNLGLLFPASDTDSNSYFSVATGVNEQGHMAAFSHGYRNHPEETGGIRTIATFHDGNAYKVLVDQTDYIQSKSNDINDNDVVVGYATRVVNSKSTPQLFYYDHNTGETVHPQGFFDSSVSVGHGINNHGMIVGIAEVQTDLITDRREHGFIYDINAQTMTDLNDLTSCNNPYRVVEAKDINDDGVIVGTALLELTQKDSLGNDVMDDNGDPVLEQVARAVKLVPIAGGSIDDCDQDDDEIIYERKGAGFGWSGLVLLTLAGIRRRLVG